jgi:hypothetical protein
VRAAAEFLAEIGDGHDDADVVAVLFAEQRHGAGGDGLVERHHVGGDFGVAEDLLVDEALDFGDFGGIDRGVVAEIETQARGFDDAAGLLDVRPEDLAERGVQQVRRGVVALGGEALGTATSARSSSPTAMGERADLVDGEAGTAGIRIETWRLSRRFARSKNTP